MRYGDAYMTIMKAFFERILRLRGCVGEAGLAWWLSRSPDRPLHGMEVYKQWLLRRSRTAPVQTIFCRDGLTLS